MTASGGLFNTGIEKLGLEIPEGTRRRMETFLDLLLEKNKVMNLTAVTEKEEALSRHLIDSLAVLKAAELKGRKIIDVGCGAGFPGMPLKLYDPTFDITLLDSQKKKTDFIQETCSVLNVAPAVLCARAEEAALDPSLREQFDIAVSRAVAPMNILCELALPFVKVGGNFLAMKMKDCEDELKESEKAIKLLGGSLFGFFDYSLPTGDAVYRIIIIKKTGKTPSIYPRRFSKIKSKPL